VHGIELTVWGVLIAVAVLLALAYRSSVPYPILLVLGGLVLGFVPGVPRITLNPDLVLVVLLPPLLYSAAFFSSLRDLRESAKQIGGLSIGLVLATTLIVGVAAHELVDSLSWAEAFVLGAVVSPTDPVAASAILERLHVPRRISTVVEGEALVNDALALVLYRVAIVAVVDGTFSAFDAGWHFVLNAAAGIAIGLVVGWIVGQIRKQIEDIGTEATISLVSGYLAYLPAERLGVSAVLATVTTGIYLGWHAPELTTPATRLQLIPVWQVLVYIVNVALFMLLGLQLRQILDGLGGYSPWALAGWAAIVVGVVTLVRVAWVMAFGTLGRLHAARPSGDWRESLLVGWMGMRGAVSLAAALAIPLTVHGGGPFPGRELIIFLTFVVILVTVLVQGLSLPYLIPLLGIEDDGRAEREEAKARMLAAQAAIERIDELQTEDWVRDETAERARNLLDYRVRRFQSRYLDGADGVFEERSLAYQRLQREILEAQRRAIVELRNEGRINDETMHRVERDLDLEDSRLEI